MRKLTGSFLIVNLLLSMFAFAFVLGGAEVVVAQEERGVTWAYDIYSKIQRGEATQEEAEQYGYWLDNEASTQDLLDLGERQRLERYLNEPTPEPARTPPPVSGAPVASEENVAGGGANSANAAAGALASVGDVASGLVLPRGVPDPSGSGGTILESRSWRYNEDNELERIPDPETQTHRNVAAGVNALSPGSALTATNARYARGGDIITRGGVEYTINRIDKETGEFFVTGEDGTRASFTPGEEGGDGYTFKGDEDFVSSRGPSLSVASAIGIASASIGLGLLIKEFLGDEPWANALGNGIAAGGTAYSIAGSFSQKTFAGANAPYLGIGVGIAVFILTYKTVEYETVFFTCQPWEAPIGGENCEVCNDGIHPCSEYRCKSLGQACALVNEGTENELCVWQNPRDVNSPAIQPLEEALTVDFQYIPIGARPPNWGTEIQPNSGGCIPAFTPIEFGIETDKPAQCKIDFLIRGGGGDVDTEPLGYDNMQFYFGNNNLYDYNHTQSLSLPSPDTVNRIGELNVGEGEELEIRNDGRYSMYVRCRSANGFYNADPYVVEFCVEEGPDLTPPVISETSIRNGEPVNYEINSVPLSIFTNEPTNCRWSRDTDLSYTEMNEDNQMACANNLHDIRDNMLYECRTELTAIKDREVNRFYFRCEDQPWEGESTRNRMQTGYEFTLVGTEPLNIKEGSVIPEFGDVISGSTDPVSVELGVQTQNGYQEGAASCLYSQDNETYIKFFETGGFDHRQNQELGNGGYTYYYQCIDQGGNFASAETTFEVFVDQTAPRIVRVLKSGNALEIVTDEEAICRYSNDDGVACNFEVNEDEGNPFQYASSDDRTKHLADWMLDETYYVKCMDLGGKEPNNIDCSIVVRPVELGVD